MTDDAFSAVPSYEDMAAAGMPMSMLPTQLVCSFPDSPDLAASRETAPHALQVAVNFVSGGLLLAVYIAHSVMDGKGAKHFIEAFAASVREGPCWAPDGTFGLDLPMDGKAPVANLPNSEDQFDRTSITISAVNAFQQHGLVDCPELKLNTIWPSKPPPPPIPRTFEKFSRSLGREDVDGMVTKHAAASPLPEVTGQIVTISMSTVKRLRDSLLHHLVENLAPTDRPRFLSRWDTLAALLWVYQLRARFGENYDPSTCFDHHPTSRSEKHSDPVTNSKVAFTMDIRRRLTPPVPDSYSGNAAVWTYTELPLSLLTSRRAAVPGTNPSKEAPQGHPLIPILAMAALRIRCANSTFDATAMAQRMAYFSQIPVESSNCLVPNLVTARPDAQLATPPPDLYINSWEDLAPDADFSICGTDLEDGRPQFVRKPKSTFSEGGTIVLPRRKKPSKQAVSGIAEEDAPYEVIVQMPTMEMDRLCSEAELGFWTERVVE